MPVRFVIGRAGSGKTTRQFRAIVEAMRDDPMGLPIYWLLPRQATFNAERALTCLSGLEAFCRTRVVWFEEFGKDVFDECGGSSIPQVTALGRQMIIGNLLRRHRDELRFYSRVARQPGLPAQLDLMFAELERTGKSAAEMGAWIKDLSESNAADLELSPLLDKLRDVRLLYEAYTKYLGQERLDQHRRLMQIEGSLSRCGFLKKTQIYVDGFVEFTDYERRILVGAAKAGASIEIALLIDPDSKVVANPDLIPDEMDLFRRTEETYRRMHFAFTQEGISIDEPVRLKATTGNETRFSLPALAELERNLFDDRSVAFDDARGLELIEAPDRAGEVDAVARQIRSLLMDGLRYRDIAVLARDLERYEARIEASFGEHDIPHFIDRRRPARHHPLLEFVRSLFQIAREDWLHDAVMSLLRSGLGNEELDAVDELENYVLAHRIRGSKGWDCEKPWGYRRETVAREDEAPAADTGPMRPEAIRKKLVERLSPLIGILASEQTRSVREFSAEIFATLERFGVRATLAQWIATAAGEKKLEHSAEHEQVWQNLVELFEQLVELLGDEPMTPAEFHDVLETGLESFDLALTPPTVDQVVVGQVDRARTGDVKAVFVLGLNEGEFPRAAADGSLLTDRDRRTLRSRRIELEPGLEQKLLDERLLGYIAFTRASDHLIVSRPLADDQGRPAEPSSFWRRIIERFANAPLKKPAPAHAPPAEEIATPRQLVTSLMRWVRSNSDPVATASNPFWPALYKWLASHADCDDAIGAMRYGAWRALNYANTADLSPQIAAELFRPPLDASVAQIEAFAACPFKHFAKYALGLRQRDAQEVTIADLGRLYHDLLETALKDVMRRRAQGERGAKLEQSVDRFIEQIGASLRNQIMLGSARNQYLLERTRRTTRHIALTQREQMKRGEFRPAHIGVTFGPGGKLPALRVSTKNGEVMLSGKIDRIDRAEGGEDVAVIDYRMGEAILPVGMVLHGLSLQLLSYLLVLEANGQQLSGKNLVPAGAFYLQLVRRIEDVKHPDESCDPEQPQWRLALKPRGLFDSRCLQMLDKELQPGGWSDVVHAYVKQDGTLGHTSTSDAAESHDFRAIVKSAAAKISELAEGILKGRIDIAPYRLKNSSPCPRCECRPVCRFDPSINRYNYLQPLSKQDVLSKAAGGDDGR